MIITYIGTGYVGTVSGAITAKKGHKVYCVDLPEKVKEIQELLKKGKIHIYEPKLKEIIEETISSEKLFITDVLEEAVTNSELIFITVGTPSNENGSVNLNYVYNVADKIADHINSYKLVVVKSTVPPGTTEQVKKKIKNKIKIPFDIAMNPEFLREGKAVDDTERPDRIVIGIESEKSEKILKEFYKPFVLNNNPIYVMSPLEAELVKYSANAHLATRISISNEIANLCSILGADYKKVALGVGSDKRIGNLFLYAGMGYGGSCFPKDVKGFNYIARENQSPLTIFETVNEINEKQKLILVKKIKSYFGELSEKTFTVWGLSFKPETDDIREAPSLSIINELLKNNCKIKVYDPKSINNVKKIFEDKLVYTKTKEEALIDSDGIILCTEWDEFKAPDFNIIKKLLKNPIIFDGRNIYDSKHLKELGIKHIGIGTGN
ncbi:UDP-glucose/GDP-mannose dehydrogenase family protein [Candidatus Woesearchaeota archaeon]|nr:UDP-glucose/GDP-mannose dehydrogenase family protein [Candidatus Woesearchaeota archaeon]